MVSPEASGIRTRRLGFAYGAREVLRSVDLEIAPGEIVGVLGPNGSGKSTLIRLLCGLLTPTRGEISIEGRAVGEMPRREMARRMAVVPQEPVFGFPFTALEVVLMGRHPHLAGLSFESERDRQRAMTELERCGAGHLADRAIQQLSSGERQRVVFARALAQDPRWLLLDEPASFLDIRYQVELYDRVRARVRDGSCGVLTVLHDLNLAAEYCDRIYLLREGRVEAAGSTRDVFTYANLTRVFETEVYVDTNALTGNLLVVPLPGNVQQRLHCEGPKDDDGN